jgi:hypothetical protein
MSTTCSRGTFSPFARLLQTEDKTTRGKQYLMFFVSE